MFGTGRATFGLLELYDGVPLIPILVGLFAISEALVMIENETIVSTEELTLARRARWVDTLEGLALTARYWWQTVWTSLIGLIIGILPGAGSTISMGRAFRPASSLPNRPTTA